MDIYVDASQRHEIERLHADWTASLKRGSFGSSITMLVEGPPRGSDRSFIINKDFATFLTARGFAFGTV